MRGTVIIFVKAPRAGQVKTRLGVDIGMGRAAALFRIMSERTIAEAQKGNWRVILAVDPPAALHGWDRFWPPHIERVAQGSGDLGARMQSLFDGLPPGPVVIVGSDIPAIRPAHIIRAFKLLASSDAVFGPALDGGYWLVGLKRSPRRLAPFAGVAWSTENTLAATLANLRGRAIAFAPTLSDVDTKEDYRREGTSGERLVPRTARRSGP